MHSGITLNGSEGHSLYNGMFPNFGFDSLDVRAVAIIGGRETIRMNTLIFLYLIVVYANEEEFIINGLIAFFVTLRLLTVVQQ